MECCTKRNIIKLKAYQFNLYVNLLLIFYNIANNESLCAIIN